MLLQTVLLVWVEHLGSTLPILKLYKGSLVFFTLIFSHKPLRSQKMKKVMLLMILCCFYIISLHAFSRGGCICLRFSPFPVSAGVVKKVEVIPPTGRCRKTEIIITRRTGSRVCADPEAKWFQDLLKTLKKGMARSSSAARPTIASTRSTDHL